MTLDRGTKIVLCPRGCSDAMATVMAKEGEEGGREGWAGSHCDGLILPKIVSYIAPALFLPYSYHK